VLVLVPVPVPVPVELVLASGSPVVVVAEVVVGTSVVAVLGSLALGPWPRPHAPKSASTSLPSRWQQPSASQL